MYKTFKNWLILTLIVPSLIFAHGTRAENNTFKDVPKGEWFTEYVEELTHDGVFEKKERFRPTDALNRAELTKIVITAIGGLEGYQKPSSPSFSDVKPSEWYYDYIEAAVQKGIVTGYTDEGGVPIGLFGPSDAVNRAAVVKILVNAFAIPTDKDHTPLFSDVPEGAWFHDFVTIAYNQSILDGYEDGRFGASDAVTRAQVAKMVVGSKKPKKRTKHTVKVVKKDHKISKPKADSETSTQPAGQTIPTLNSSPSNELGITDPYQVFAEPNLVRPGSGEYFTDPVFGTTIRRLSGRTNGYERHEYSQLQAYNSDHSKVLLNSSSLGYIVRDTESLEVIFTLPGDINAPRWWPKHPNRVIYFDSNDVGSGNRLVRIDSSNILTGERETIATLPDRFDRVAGAISWEELSRDGRWITAYLYNTDGNMTFLAYDLENKQVGAEITLSGDLYGGACSASGAGPNWLAPSPLGNYLVIQWNGDGRRGDSPRCTGVEAYDIESGEYVGHVGSHRHHSDMGLDHHGREIYVTDYFGQNDLLTTTLFPGSPNFEDSYDKVILDSAWFHLNHMSCQGPAGVCVITASGDRGQPFDGEIYLVYTDGFAEDWGKNDLARVRRLAHHRSSSCDYRAQPQASMSEDGSFVIYGSDFGNCGGGADAYAIYLEELPSSPTPSPEPSLEPEPEPRPEPNPNSIPEPNEPENATSIDLHQSFGDLIWSIQGDAPDGIKVTWSKSENPTYPPRHSDKAVYVDSGNTYKWLNDFDGPGTYYVRVCEYLGNGACGTYSNQISVFLGGTPENQPPTGLPETNYNLQEDEYFKIHYSDPNYYEPRGGNYVTMVAEHYLGDISCTPNDWTEIDFYIDEGKQGAYRLLSPHETLFYTGGGCQKWNQIYSLSVPSGYSYLKACARNPNENLVYCSQPEIISPNPNMPNWEQ